ncbi:hypothetical protein BT67DRAFT_282339 [Trichocladium antarcticum]|uniref:Uncharacterized protein n=1 Tax=Trichocladium antarcticum TaxID=1450529 RepID=A0AAN6UKR3_9PEZI|nr:hypothetical protein BT67DRAFT_282339 [Trichocladium antarcticum]
MVLARAPSPWVLSSDAFARVRDWTASTLDRSFAENHPHVAQSFSVCGWFSKICLFGARVSSGIGIFVATRIRQIHLNNRASSLAPGSWATIDGNHGAVERWSVCWLACLSPNWPPCHDPIQAPASFGRLQGNWPIIHSVAPASRDGVQNMWGPPGIGTEQGVSGGLFCCPCLLLWQEWAWQSITV